MPNDPEVSGEYVIYDCARLDGCASPEEAEALALDLLGVASKARANRRLNELKAEEMPEGVADALDTGVEAE